MKTFLKKYQDYFAVCGITLIFLCTILYIVGFFTDSSTLISGDLQAQYMPLFFKWKEILIGNNSLFYAFNKGIGGGFLGTFFYYLSSPFNLLIVFFEQSNFCYFILLLFSLKVILSSLTMYIYLKKHFPNIIFLYRLMFSILYAFSSYMLGYLFNIMWLDALYFLPILLIGIEKIIDEQKILLYSIILFLSIFCNYYIGYMLCIFSVIYFFYYSYIHYQDKKFFQKNCFLFFIVSLLVGLCCSFFLLPSFIDFLNSTHILSVNEKNELLKINNWNFLAYFFLNGNKTIDYLNANFYYLYAGILIFPLIILYFFHKDIPLKEKKATFFVFLTFIISIFIPFFDKIWHLFSNPMYYAGRYSFLFIFFSIIVACRSLEQIPKLDKKYYFYIVFLFPVGGYLLYMMKTTSLEMVCINVILYLLYLTILGNLKKEKKLSYFLGLLAFGEVFFFASYSLEEYRMRSSWKEELIGYYNSMKEEIDFIKDRDTTFYRIYDSHLHTSNPGFYLNYNGIDVFYSTVNKKVMNFLRPFSYEARLNDVNYAPMNEIINSILGVKYLLVEGNKIGDSLFVNGKDYKDYSILYEHSMKIGISYLYGIFNTNSYILENGNVLPLGFMISGKEEILDDFTMYSNSYVLSNAILNSMIPMNGDIYEEIFPLKKENSYILSDISNKKIIVVMKNKKNKLFTPTLYLNGDEWSSYGESTSIEIEIPNDFIKDGSVEFSYSLLEEKEVDVKFYCYNEESFKERINRLKEHSFEISIFEDTYVKGKVSVDKDFSTLFLSIPMEDGWSIYVDGKKQVIKTLYNTFIGLDLEEGEHEIELKYFPPGLKFGSIISVFSLLGLCLIQKRLNKR